MGKIYLLVLKVKSMVETENSNVETCIKQGMEHNKLVSLNLIKEYA